MITSKQPTNWQDLQNYVAEVLNECGWEATTEQTIPLVRGKAEIDVLAIETIEARKYKILIECKYWNSRVSQDVVHSFRTIVQDSGANAGYIISKTGFQRGALDAAAATPIKLLTWDDFQNEFTDEWYWKYLVVQASTELSLISRYLEPLTAMRYWWGSLPEEDIEYLSNLHEKYSYFGYLVGSIYPLKRTLFGTNTDMRIKLPLSVPQEHYFTSDDQISQIPSSLISIPTYREFYEELKVVSNGILEEIQQFKRKAASLEQQE
ncbi:restriction endonuclease [Ochrobactrum sp. MR28]|nr:restriction endonuclease [Ochrobactrum sp. MR28]